MSSEEQPRAHFNCFYDEDQLSASSSFFKRKSPSESFMISKPRHILGKRNLWFCWFLGYRAKLNCQKVDSTVQWHNPLNDSDEQVCAGSYFINLHLHTPLRFCFVWMEMGFADNKEQWRELASWKGAMSSLRCVLFIYFVYLFFVFVFFFLFFFCLFVWLFLWDRSEFQKPCISGSHQLVSFFRP